MSKKPVHNNFFEKSFSRVEVAKGYLDAYLPDAIRQLIDLDTLTPEKEKYIDRKLDEQQSDMLYSAKLVDGDAINIYFLWEHKSYIVPMVGFQLLKYMVRIWELDEANKRPLMPILPIVVYHGERRWKIETQFVEAFTVLPDAFRPYTPNFAYYLSDFSYRSDEEMKGNLWIQVCRAVLQAIFDPDLQHKLPELVTLAFQLREQKTGLDYGKKSKNFCLQLCII